MQEDPPNDWYVCVLCGEHFDPSDSRRKFCIEVIRDGDVFHLPVHTDCLSGGVGDDGVRRTLRRYSAAIRRELIRIRRRRDGVGG